MKRRRNRLLCHIRKRWREWRNEVARIKRALETRLSGSISVKRNSWFSNIYIYIWVIASLLLLRSREIYRWSRVDPRSSVRACVFALRSRLKWIFRTTLSLVFRANVNWERRGNKALDARNGWLIYLHIQTRLHSI